MSDTTKEQILRLEAEYDRLYDEIENRRGGVDSQGRLAPLRAQINALRREARLEIISNLEAKYDQLYDRVEKQGGIDYQGHLAPLRKKIDSLRRQADLWANMRKATESNDMASAMAVVDILLDEDADDTIAEIAADFIENEVGRFDWQTNWQTIKRRGDPTPQVQAYLDSYGIAADARQVVNQIDWMVQNNPGRWK